MADKKIEDLEKRLEALEKNMTSGIKKEKKPRKPTKYNEFMKKELARIKKDEEGITHKDAWSKASSGWSKSSDNPKNND